jgi:hypothetical protein
VQLQNRALRVFAFGHIAEFIDFIGDFTLLAFSKELKSLFGHLEIGQQNRILRLRVLFAGFKLASTCEARCAKLPVSGILPRSLPSPS